MINSNMVHNGINFLLILTGLVGPLLAATGCIHNSVADTYDCSASWLPPTWIPFIMAGLAVVKVIINLGRDGLGGLMKPQPPVADKMTTVVQPIDVIAEKGAKKEVDVKVETTVAPARNYNLP